MELDSQQTVKRSELRIKGDDIVLNYVFAFLLPFLCLKVCFGHWCSHRIWRVLSAAILLKSSFLLNV